MGTVSLNPRGLNPQMIRNAIYVSTEETRNILGHYSLRLHAGRKELTLFPSLICFPRIPQGAARGEAPQAHVRMAQEHRASKIHLQLPKVKSWHSWKDAFQGSWWVPARSFESLIAGAECAGRSVPLLLPWKLSRFWTLRTQLQVKVFVTGSDITVSMAFCPRALACLSLKLSWEDLY